MSKTVTLLSVEQSERLEVLETVIRDNMAGFLRVGMALMEIKDERLYLADHKTFKQYVEKVWHMSRSYAYRLIDTAKVYGNIESRVANWRQSQLPAPEDGQQTPLIDTETFNESQARELVKLKSPDLQAKAWETVNERFPGKVTAAKIKKVVKEIGGDNISKAAKKAEKLTEESSETSEKSEVPGNSFDDAFRAAYQNFMSEIDRVRRANWKGCSRKDLLIVLSDMKEMVEQQGMADELIL